MKESPAPEHRLARLQLVCSGVLQGLGVRPSLRRLALGLGLRGSLDNGCGTLEIDLCGARPALEAFQAGLADQLPAGARLEGVEARWSLPPEPPWSEGIRISVLGRTPLHRALIAPGLTADRAPCPQCLAELGDPASRRHRYPFISCCTCGPRFTLATHLPFCRSHTTLAAFPPCPACVREFQDPEGRRFHAETISCPICGPRLTLVDGAGAPLAEGEQALLQATERLLAGEILALQGVGGFQLLVDATQDAAVARLRRRKRRPARPFALLVGDPRVLEPEVRPTAAQEQALRQPAAPIVLLPRRFVPGLDPWSVVAPGSPVLGVMLPASGLHQLLVQLLGRPLVATSGNRSGEPLCIAPGEALERLAGIADVHLVHDLPIARPLDDSLVQLIDGRPALLRRARGYVPEPLAWNGIPQREGALLALGGDLKAAPAVVRGDRIWFAPHLGDLADAAVQRRWQEGVEDQLQGAALGVRSLACDVHPGYVSQQAAARLAERHRLPLKAVPHHLAHGLAVLAESGCPLPLLVVACDGLGLTDPDSGEGQERLWGGELLLVAKSGEAGPVWQRLAALRPFPLPGGERASREPRRCALGLLAAAGPWALAHPGAASALEAFSPAERGLLLDSLAAGCQAPLTSSLGRLLDGLVSLLALVQVLSYEGEGGLRWQGAAARWQASGAGPMGPERREADLAGEATWHLPLVPPAAESSGGDSLPLPLGRWDWEPLLRALLHHVATGGDPDHGAWLLETAVVEGIVGAAVAAGSWSGCPRVALTGGCFQNGALLERCLQGLRSRGLEPLWNAAVPCSDGGLALGQAWAAQDAGPSYNRHGST